MKAKFLMQYFVSVSRKSFSHGLDPEPTVSFRADPNLRMAVTARVNVDGYRVAKVTSTVISLANGFSSNEN